MGLLHSILGLAPCLLGSIEPVPQRVGSGPLDRNRLFRPICACLGLPPIGVSSVCSSRGNVSPLFSLFSPLLSPICLYFCPFGPRIGGNQEYRQFRNPVLFRGEFARTFGWTFARTFAWLYLGIIGHHDEGPPVVAWLRPPPESARPHPHRIGREAKPRAGLCIGQPIGHGSGLAHAGELWAHVRAHVQDHGG
ncbi:MAG: hypothetical protein JO264_13915 [Acidisphaera sp.]|nr:hypothetical protein [Acidisphaera sp.]